MKPRAQIYEFLMLSILIINIESHPRHDRNDSRSNSNKVLTDYSDDVQKYLMEFGYLPKSNLETGNLRTEEQLRDAIRQLQKYAGLPQTGKMDEKTQTLMRMPRCGVPDIGADDFLARNRRLRFKRFVIHEGLKWQHLNITWSLVNQTMTKFNPGLARRIFHEALAVWSKHSNLNFRETLDPDADIQILFAKGHHGDGYQFDGPGNVLAHAFYPGSQRGGDAHFDEEENWHLDDRTIDRDGTSLKNVAVHEFGHSLGLGHSSVVGAVMYPWYQGYRGDGDLPEDDRIAIQQLYGSRDGKVWGPNPGRRHHYTQPTTRTTTTQRPTTRRPERRHPNDYPYRNGNEFPTRNPNYPRYYPSETTVASILPTTRRSTHHHHHHEKPDTCNTSYDAITMIRGEIFIFKGRYLWRISDNGLNNGYPHEITKMWRELPNDLTHIDTVYENKKRQIVFFIGNQYYVFSSMTLLPGYPKPLYTLGLPENIRKIDAALVWGHNNRTYFYSGTMYWRFDEDEMQVELDYPRDMSMWKGIGYNIDSAFQYKDGKTYFFKNKGFWQFDDLRMKVVHDHLKPSAQRWMGCKTKKSKQNNNVGINGEKRNEKLYEEVSDVDDTYDYFEEDGDIEVSSAVSTIDIRNKISILSISVLFTLNHLV